ncbi:WAP four-disulfide core domain protein 2 isoform X1 [Camelus dromedarius]|uniref:WAP four-disulfide core domain protein 2 isoform X1 n=1 Tax=Camelus dromedarius TaxID=9838 RepID=UPI0031195893
MPARRLGLLVAALLLGLLLGLPPVTGAGAGAGAEKTGVCPALEADVNCTKECLSDAECADNLKCCPAGCAAVCQMPNEKKGSCPQIDLAFPQLGFCVNKCQEDSQCPGNMKCCLNGCGKMSCVTPVF